ncbi:MAG TPA: hypothetical protein VED02_02500 [Methyloceanibacter sp.]|nr:hypothetical protein [Methyloceanibacter sp.]
MSQLIGKPTGEHTSDLSRGFRDTLDQPKNGATRAEIEDEEYREQPMDHLREKSKRPDRS